MSNSTSLLYGINEVAKHEEEGLSAELISFYILFVIMLLIIGALGGYYFRLKKIRFILESPLLVAIGMLGGFLLKYFGFHSDLLAMYTGFPDIFFLVLIPIIVFHSSFAMNKKIFFEYVGTVLVYGFVGTFIEIVIISTVFYLWDFTFYEAIFYAALIAMLDPISIISVFESMPISKNFYTVLFGESIFTNAVVMILFEILFQPNDYEDITSTKLFLAIASFVMILLGSFIVGALGGFLAAFILKKFHWLIENPNKNKLNLAEAGVMTILPIVTYLLAEALELSGLAAILFSGIILSQYAAENLTFQTRRVLKLLYQACSYLCRGTTFIFLGMCAIVDFGIWEKTGILLILENILIVLGSRLVSVFLCDIISTFSLRLSLEEIKKKIIVWYSGLRGTLTYVLAFSYAQDLKTGNGETIVALALTFSLFTLLVQPLFLDTILNVCDVKQELPRFPKGVKSGVLVDLKYRFAYLDQFYLRKYFMLEERDKRPSKPTNETELQENQLGEGLLRSVADNKS